MTNGEGKKVGTLQDDGASVYVKGGADEDWRVSQPGAVPRLAVWGTCGPFRLRAARICSKPNSSSLSQLCVWVNCVGRIRCGSRAEAQVRLCRLRMRLPLHTPVLLFFRNGTDLEFSVKLCPAGEKRETCLCSVSDTHDQEQEMGRGLGKSPRGR